MQYAVLAQLLGVICLHMEGMHSWSDLIQISSVAELGMLISTTLTAYFALPPAARVGSNSINPARFSQTGGLVLALVLGGLVTMGCGTTVRHFAVTSDKGFATAIFAADYEWSARCKPGTALPEWCGPVGDTLKSALTDIKAVSLALKATPKDALTMPKGLPDIAADLMTVQGILTPLVDADTGARAVLGKVLTAINEAEQLLQSLLGGQ